MLRGGKEAFRSSAAIVKALREGLTSCGLCEDLIQLVQDTSRNSATELMTAVGLVDLLIPRGGAGLINACVQNATVPCIATGTGICHVYVEATADQEMALAIIENAKTSRPSVCNAEEVLLVDKAIAAEFLPKLASRIGGRVEFRLDGDAAAIIPGTPASDTDFDTEFLDYILGVKVVDGVQAAVEKHPDLHIIHFDAHADLRQEYLGVELSHACVMRRCHDLVGDGRIHQFCIRSGERDEFRFAKEHTDMHRFDLNGLDELLEELKSKKCPVYLTIDLDCLDPSEFPGTGTPEAGGISFKELLGAVLKVSRANVIAADINELAPMLDMSGASTALACKLLRELMLALLQNMEER